MEKTERNLRIQLAACYRIFDYMGWSEMIFNHITVKIPGDEHHFLINPYGLHYSEVTASNLVKVDIDGNIVEETDYAVNPAGIVIHTAIHAARPEINCIAHTHTIMLALWGSELLRFTHTPPFLPHPPPKKKMLRLIGSNAAVAVSPEINH